MANSAQEISERKALLSEWIEEFATTTAALMQEECPLPTTAREALLKSAADINADLTREGVYDSYSVTDVQDSVDRRHGIKTMTIHRAKGREFSAVAVVDLFEGRIPYGRQPAPDEVAEASRQLYVAITRAERMVLYLTDVAKHRNVSRFLGKDWLNVE
ncbi:MAG: ATP-dependent helicase [Candidatus Eremiobacteraeota bacterium]|nr:ATP-dependent helicase [Candidatus Eremiobacteraeota bacterium]